MQSLIECAPSAFAVGFQSLWPYHVRLKVAFFPMSGLDAQTQTLFEFTCDANFPAKHFDVGLKTSKR